MRVLTRLPGGEGVDTINGAGGDDIITIAAAGKGNTDVMDGGADADVLQLSTGAHAFADDAKLKNIETIKTASGGSEVDLSAQTEALTITGDAGVDKITGGEGVDTIDGAGGDDIIAIAAAGKDNTDVMDGGADADVLQLSTGAHAFADDAKLKNIETIKTASGGSEVDLSAQTEALTITGDAGVDKITGGEGVDTIDGAGGDDIITIAAAGKGNTDVMDGGADADVLQLSTGAHAFADDDKLKNIETIKTASGGSEVDLSAQTEALTITGDAGVDKITGGEGVDTIDGAGGDDIITIAAAGKGNTDVMDGGADADVLQLSTGAHAFADNAKLKNIETINDSWRIGSGPFCSDGSTDDYGRCGC